MSGLKNNKNNKHNENDDLNGQSKMDLESGNHDLSGNESKKNEMVTISSLDYDALKLKEQEALESRNQMLRLQADFENSRKRLERDKAMFIKFASEQMISELIPIVDDFQRAFQAADNTKDFNVLHKGVEMILKHLLEILKDKGVRDIEALGKTFDPRYHEAMMQDESEDHPENTVLEEIQKGYMINDRVLRTAKVRVSKKREGRKDSESKADE